MTIKADTDSLAADGTALFDGQAGAPPPGCEPASAHTVSMGVSGQLSAHSTSLDLLINHAQQVRAEGGAATLNTAAMLPAADEGGAAVIAGKTSMSGSVSAPIALASLSAPALPGIPAMPVLPPATGESHAVAVHTGPGSASYRSVAEYWLNRATALDKIAGDTTQTSAAIDAHWSDGNQRAGVNTAVHGTWWSELAGRARALAAAANDAADQHDTWVAATPTEKEFADARNRLAKAQEDNKASRGLLSGLVSAAAAQLAQLHGQAIEAATANHAASSATMGGIQAPPGTAPSIANGGGSGGSDMQSGNGSVDPNATGVGSAPGLLNTVLGGAGTNGGAGMIPGLGAGGMDPTMMSMLPMMMMPAMMAPMAAMSGLGGLGKQNTPSAFSAQSAGWPADVAPDGGLGGDLAGTMPAAGGGGGVDAAVGPAPALPAAGPAAPSPTAVSGPASSLVTPAEAAATAPASTAGGGGMSPMPPMMGAPGAGDAGAQRDARLFPDRRMVWRPVPNTEAVFGELQRERRPRAKRERAKPADGSNAERTDEGSGGGQQ
jgi:hypothetical protein